jgi:hypothetical protein
MTNTADVEPEALKSMSKKVQILREELDAVSKKLIINAESLHQQGFKDKKFDELFNRVNESRKELSDLIFFMEKYNAYLERQVKRLMNYDNSPKL